MNLVSVHVCVCNCVCVCARISGCRIYGDIMVTQNPGSLMEAIGETYTINCRFTKSGFWSKTVGATWLGISRNQSSF